MRSSQVLLVALAVLSGGARASVQSLIGTPNRSYTIRLAGAEVRATRW